MSWSQLVIQALFSSIELLQVCHNLHGALNRPRMVSDSCFALISAWIREGIISRFPLKVGVSHNCMHLVTFDGEMPSGGVGKHTTVIHTVSAAKKVPDLVSKIEILYTGISFYYPVGQGRKGVFGCFTHNTGKSAAIEVLDE